MARYWSNDQFFVRLRQLTAESTEPVAEDFEEVAERRDDSVRRLKENQQSGFILQDLEPAFSVVCPRRRKSHDQGLVGRHPRRGDSSETRRWSRDGFCPDPCVVRG